MNATVELQGDHAVPPLLDLYFYLTRGCNLACRHCWLSPAFESGGDSGGHLDVALFEKAVREAIPLGLRRVKLTGGEPLLHPDFESLVAISAGKGLGVTVETNGVLITPEVSRLLGETRSPRFVSVSLDGASPSTHDSFRGVEGSFEAALRGIRLLVTAGLRPQVIMSLHPGNVDEIEPLVRVAEAVGAGSVKFNLLQPSGRAKRMKEHGMMLGVARLIQLGRWIEADLQKRTSVDLWYSWPMAFYGLRRLLVHGGATCKVLTILGVLPDGQLALCGIGEHVPELCYGKVGADPVGKVWSQHPALRELRDALPNSLEGVCGRCLLKGRCLGHCIALNYLQAKRTTAAHWFCSEAWETGCFPASRLVERC